MRSRIKCIFVVLFLVTITACDIKTDVHEPTSEEDVYDDNLINDPVDKEGKWQDFTDKDVQVPDSIDNVNDEDNMTGSFSSSDVMCYISDTDRLFNEFINNKIPAEYNTEDGSTCYCYYKNLQEEGDGCYIAEKRDLDGDGEYELLLAESLDFRYFLDARNGKIYFLGVNPNSKDEHFSVGYAYFEDEYWIVASNFYAEEYRIDFYGYDADGEVSREFSLVKIWKDNVEKSYYNDREISKSEYDEIWDSIRLMYYDFE